MKIKTFVFLFFLLTHTKSEIFSQDSYRNYFLEWSTWSLFQAVPSPYFIDDRNESGSVLLFSLKWEITPVSFSYNMNPYTNRWSFFKVMPVKRHSGSVELDFQPLWAMKSFDFSGFERFGFAAGIRTYIPLIEYGEYLSASFGLNYNRFNLSNGNAVSFPSAEISLYTLFGFLGARVNYNFYDKSKFNFGINIKFY